MTTSDTHTNPQAPARTRCASTKRAARRPQPFAWSSLGLAATVLLAGCGGGGGSSDAGSPGTGGTTGASTTTSSKINQQNVDAQAAGAYQVTAALYGAGATGATQAKSAPADGGPPASAIDFALMQLDDLNQGRLGGVSTPKATQVKSVGSATSACVNGGSVSVTVNDADNSGTLTRADMVTFTFSNCSEGGYVVNGTMTMTQFVETGTYGGPAYSAGATFNYSGFSSRSAAGGTATVVVDGDLSLQAAYQTSPQVLVSATVAGTRFSATANGVTGTLTNYSATVTVNDTTGQFAYAVQGTQSDGAGNSIAVATPTPFRGTVGTFPSTGVLTITASDQSAARVTATSPTSVQIDLDANGDGTYEYSVTRTWAQLAAA